MSIPSHVLESSRPIYRAIVDDIELQDRRKHFDNWEWKELTAEYKHGYLIRMAMDIHTYKTGDDLFNGFKTFSLVGTHECFDGDCSGTHLDLLMHPNFETANGQLIRFIIAKGTEALLCEWGYSEVFQRNLGLHWRF
jgi:hypothetical protein